MGLRNLLSFSRRKKSSAAATEEETATSAKKGGDAPAATDSASAPKKEKTKRSYVLVGNMMYSALLLGGLGAGVLWLQGHAETTINKRLLKNPRITVDIPADFYELAISPAPAAHAAPPVPSATPASPPPPAVAEATPEPASASTPATAGADATPLRPSPLPEILEVGKLGPLPKIGAAGERAWDLYARPSVMVGNSTPKISIILSNLGLKEDLLKQALATLPREVVFSFSPYAINLNQMIVDTRQQGHEVTLDLPLQSSRPHTEDLGAYVLGTSVETRENQERLEWILSRSSGYIGVINKSGDLFVRHDTVLEPILNAIVGRGILFIDNKVHEGSLSHKFLSAQQQPVVALDVQADALPAQNEILKNLAAAERDATLNGATVIYADASPLSITTLAGWLKSLESKNNVRLVPVSTLARLAAPAAATALPASSPVPAPAESPAPASPEPASQHDAH